MRRGVFRLCGFVRQQKKAEQLLGARVLGEDLGLACVEAFVNTEFEGGRHAKRVGKIEL